MTDAPAASTTTMGAQALSDIVVNFPLTIILEHPPMDLMTMFNMTQAFDMYEMESDVTDHEGLVKENILVDVLDLTPTQTTVKVTPAQPMAYKQLARHVDVMVQLVGKRMFKTKLKVLKLIWEIDKTGVASDLRGMLRKVR